MTRTEVHYPRIAYDPCTGRVMLEYPGALFDWALSPGDLCRLQREIAQARAQQISAEARTERTGISRLKQGVMRLVKGAAKA